jgi:hypothetical protein
MPQDIHRPTDRVYDGGKVLTLAFERIGGGIAAGAAPTSVQRPHAEVALQRRTYWGPHGMIRRGAMHE